MISYVPHLTWEIRCGECGRSSWDGKPDDPDSERCPFCGQLEAQEKQ